MVFEISLTILPRLAWLDHPPGISRSWPVTAAGWTVPSTQRWRTVGEMVILGSSSGKAGGRYIVMMAVLPSIVLTAGLEVVRDS